MNRPQHSKQSQLFTVRVWPDGEDRRAWCGQVRHVTSGDVRYFRNWATLVVQLLDLLARARTDRPVDGQGNELEE